MATLDFVYNHDVAGFQRRINRFIEEMMFSQSNGVSQVTSFDQVRLQSYIDAFRAYQGFVIGVPQLDLPETHPRQFALEKNPEVPDIENESLRDVIRMWELVRDELMNSQSSRLPSGLIPFDSVRATALVDKIESFLTTYIATVTPLDLPETSPRELLAPAGHTGV